MFYFIAEPDFLDNEKLEKMRKLINSHSVNNNETHIGENSACSNGTSTSNNSRPGRTRNSLPKSSQKKVGLIYVNVLYLLEYRELSSDE